MTAVELVWADLDEVDADPADLAAHERARAERLDDPVARRRWVAGRSTLRRELAARGIDASSLAVSGPLALIGGLHVSTSRSGRHAVIAFASKRVGVDVERVRPVRVRHRIAARAFGLDDADLDDESFVQRWCELEAFVKAFGVPLADGFGAVIPDGWEVRTIDAPAGHRAAVVVER